MLKNILKLSTSFVLLFGILSTPSLSFAMDDEGEDFPKTPQQNLPKAPDNNQKDIKGQTVVALPPSGQILPNDCLTIIFSYLGAQNQGRAGKVCKLWNTLKNTISEEIIGKFKANQHGSDVLEHVTARLYFLFKPENFKENFEYLSRNPHTFALLAPQLTNIVAGSETIKNDLIKIYNELKISLDYKTELRKSEGSDSMKAILAALRLLADTGDFRAETDLASLPFPNSQEDVETMTSIWIPYYYGKPSPWSAFASLLINFPHKIEENLIEDFISTFFKVFPKEIAGSSTVERLSSHLTMEHLSSNLLKRYNERKEYEKGLSFLEKYCSKDSLSWKFFAIALNSLYYTEDSRDRFIPLAETFLNSSIKFFPEEKNTLIRSSILSNLSKAYDKKGNSEKALVLLSQFQSDDPEDKFSLTMRRERFLAPQQVVIELNPILQEKRTPHMTRKYCEFILRIPYDATFYTKAEEYLDEV